MTDIFYRFTNTGTSGGVRLSNTFHVHEPSGAPLTLAALDAICTAFNTFYTSNASYLAGSVFWTSGARVLAYDLDALGPAPVIAPVTPLTTTGGSGGDPLPSSTAMVLSWRTAMAGASYRGRTFFGVLPKTVMTSGVFTGAITGTIVSRCTILINAVKAVAGNPELVVFSRTLPALTPIVNATIDAVPDNLSSRKY